MISAVLHPVGCGIKRLVCTLCDYWRGRRIDKQLREALKYTRTPEERRLLLCLQGRFDEVERMNTLAKETKSKSNLAPSADAEADKPK